MQLRQLFDAETSTYSYLIWCDHSREAVLIDPVLEQVERDIRYIRELELKLIYTLETHVHADHISGGGKIREALQSQYAVHENSQCDCADHLLQDGDKLVFGKEILNVLYTPGHTNTDICFSSQKMVFTGDCLLIRASGRTDFQSGDSGTAWDSITQKLFTLPDHTLVYPGHDYDGFTSSTIGEEKSHNPRLSNQKNRQDYREIMDTMNLPKPKKIDIAVPGNLKCGLSSSVEKLPNPEAQQEVLDDINMWYNSECLHSYLGYMSPNDFKLQVMKWKYPRVA